MNNIYGNFIWWQGVVEDKMDPLMLGRCRVRILGYHTDDKTEIPTKDLPWATIMQPTTSAAISGVGTTPLGPVEGTWVIGFFRDGEDAQEPIIMGTIGGIPQEGADPQKGFNDPFGKYPKDEYLPNEFREVPKDSHNYVSKGAEPDTNRLARGDKKIPTQDFSAITDDSIPRSHGENAQSLIWKRKTRQEGVPKALAGDLSSSISDTGESFYMGDVIDEDIDNFNYYWNEPHPRYGGVKKSKTEFTTTNSSCYPYNHVRESESGHIEEWDDTVGAERLHKFHASGTFEEIQGYGRDHPLDGTRVVKVVGNDYEIIAGEKNVLVSGDCNITVEGNCRLLVMRSMVQEVRGNYHLNVLGDMRVKVGGNLTEEIMSARKVKVEKDDDLKVGKSQVVNIGVSSGHHCGKSCAITAGSVFSTNSGGGSSLVAGTDMFLEGKDAIDISGGKIAGLGAPITNITGTGLVNITAPIGVINVLAPLINIIAVAAINAAAPLIDIIGGGMVNIGAPDLNEVSAAHIVISGLYNAHAGLITLN